MFFVVLAPLASGGIGGDSAFLLFGGFGFFGFLLLSVIMLVLLMLAQAGFANAALKAHDTGTVGIGDFFQINNIGNVLLFGLVVGIAQGLLSFTGIGSLVVGALTVFGLFLVIDRKLGFWDAIVGSAKLFVSNFAQSAILYILVIVISAVGAMLCGLGLLVTAPLSALAIGTFYRTLGEIPEDFKVG